jgi:hypothetical protein
MVGERHPRPADDEYVADDAPTYQAVTVVRR